MDVPITHIGDIKSPPALSLILREPKNIGRNYSYRYSRLELSLEYPEVIEIKTTVAPQRVERSRENLGQFSSGKLTISKDWRGVHPSKIITERLTGELNIGNSTYQVEFVYDQGIGKPRLTSISKKSN